MMHSDANQSATGRHSLARAALRRSGRPSVSLDPLAGGGFPNFLNVGEVSGPPRCEFRCNKVVSGEKEHLQAALRVDDSLEAAFPCRVKINSRNVATNINGDRLPSEGDKAAPVSKVFHADIFNGSTEGGKRGIDRLGVGWVCFYKQVQILRGAGLGVERYGIASDDKVFNAVGVEGGQEVLEVLVHPGLCLSGRRR